MLKSLRTGAFVALAIVATSCGSSGDAPVTPPSTSSLISSVTVTGSVTSLPPGGTTTLSATAYTSSGSAVAGANFTWSSSSDAVATVSQAGVVTAVAPGTATITAADGAVTGTFTLTVNAAVATVTLSAPKTTLAPGESETIAVTLRDASGNALTGRSISWSSSASSVATVTNAGVVNAIAAGSATITATSEGKSSALTLTVGASSLVEQHIVAQQGFAIALASTVLQSQLQTLVTLIDESEQRCGQLVGGGSIKRSTAHNAVPAIVTVYFGSDCTRPYMVETVSTFTQDAATFSFHLIANAVYTGPTGTALGSIAFNEFANNIDFVGDRLVGTVNGLGIYTSLAGAPSVQLGLNCDFGTPNHNVALCQGGIAQDVPEVSQAVGSVTTLALDSTSTGALNFSGNSILTSGPVGSLTLTAPSTLSMVVQGGSTYGNATATGSAATFSLFPPTPTGWSVTDTARDAVFRIDVIDNTTRNLSGTTKRISTGATLASFALDQSGTGTITWSDGSTAPVVGWTTR